jgi:hypothetical protein
VNLSDYAGQAATVQIRVTTDGSEKSSLYLDDFAFSSSPPTIAGGGEGMHPTMRVDQNPDTRLPSGELESKR